MNPQPSPTPFAVEVAATVGTATVSVGATSLSFVAKHPEWQDLALFVGLLAGTLSILASLCTIITRLRNGK